MKTIRNAVPSPNNLAMCLELYPPTNKRIIELININIDVDRFADFQLRFHAERLLGDVEPI